jgi:sigma-E factor negative regulatory protein RseC
MLEETGTVVRADSENIWVETRAKSSCSHCGAHSCSTSVIAKLFGNRRNLLRLPNTLQARPGQQVVIGIPDRVLVAASMRAYLLPLLGLILGVAGGGWLGYGDFLQVLLGGAGLFMGLVLIGRASESGKARERYAPQLLRVAGAPTFEIDTTALTRSRT